MLQDSGSCVEHPGVLVPPRQVLQHALHSHSLLNYRKRIPAGHSGAARGDTAQKGVGEPYRACPLRFWPAGILPVQNYLFQGVIATK